MHLLALHFGFLSVAGTYLFYYLMRLGGATVLIATALFFVALALIGCQPKLSDGGTPS